ncbi:N-acetylmuramic acid 6-phosphate etherase [Myxococcota bacterium]|nr:N-acetylmuramic acid 6-phosphate etherase [Myxococcota bacterium]
MERAELAETHPCMHPSATEFPTEALLESARDLDQLPTSEVLRLIHEEDARAHAAVGRVLPAIEQAVDVLATALSGGGRWFNVGAGTSGRLGVLDASEMPPTFGLSPRIVQGVIAGGERALRHPVEGAEDESETAIFELNERGLTLGDAVVAISASGRTPFALGAFEAAHAVDARRIAITCDPRSPLAEAAEVVIAPEVGPEVVAGSTRMKGGLAQKMVLAALSTAVMVKLGRVRGNMMTHVTPVSSKLRGRAVRIVMSLGQVDRQRARELLRETEGCIEAALQKISRPHS